MTWDQTWNLIVQVCEVVGDFVTVAGAALVVVLALTAGRVSFPERLLLSAPINRSRRSARRALRQEGVGRVEARKQTRAAASALRNYARSSLLGQAGNAAEFVERTVAQSDGGNDLDSARPVVRTLKELALRAAAPGRQGALAQALWPQPTKSSERSLQQVRDYLDEITALDRTQIAPSAFAAVVARYTGAAMLADGIDSRSGVFDEVRLWHRWEWVGPHRPHPIDPTERALIDYGTPWSSRHVGHDQGVVLDAAPHAQPMRPGDYDGRVLDLVAVRPMIDRRTDRSIVLLQTRESCYNVSERSERYRDKHLPTTPDLSAPGGAPEFVKDGAGYRRKDSGRVLLLTSCLTLISLADPNKPQIVLARRSGRSNNANNVISATAGGVFDGPRWPGDGDVDEFGRPDVATGIGRETLEELGFRLDARQAAPVAVFVSTVQGRPSQRYGRENGQLVAVVAHIAQTPRSAAEIEQSRSLRSDWGKGRFEIDDLFTLDLPVPRSRDQADIASAARSFIRDQLTVNANLIDQNAAVSLMYAAAYQYGSRQVAEALDAVAPPEWWSTPWAGEETSAAVRIVCHPEALFAP